MGELRGESRTRVLRGSWTLERWHKCCSEPTTQVDVQPQEPSSIEMVSISWLLPQPIASVHTLRCHGGHQCSGSEEQAAAGCQILPELRAPWEAMNIPQNQHPGLWCESRELRGGKRPESGQAVDVPETGTAMARYSGGCPLGQCLRAGASGQPLGTRQWALLTGQCGSSWLAAQVWGRCELEQPGAKGLLAFQRRNWTHHREESCWIPTTGR